MPLTFDSGELLARLDGDWDFLGETVQMLSEDGIRLLGEIRQAALDGDAAGVGSAAHTLKGMLSNFCAAASVAAALDLERLGKAGDFAAAPAAIDVLEARLSALIAELTEFLVTRPR